MPSRKVGSGALAGAVAGLIVWSLDVFVGVKIPAEQAVALSTILTFIVSYLMPNAQQNNV